MADMAMRVCRCICVDDLWAFFPRPTALCYLYSACLWLCGISLVFRAASVSGLCGGAVFGERLNREHGSRAVERVDTGCVDG